MITTNFFDKDINNEVKANPKTFINAKVVGAMKRLQTLYNDDANKITKQATKEKSAIENLNSLINLAMVTNDTKPVPGEPQIVNKAWNHPNKDSQKRASSDSQGVHVHEQATCMVHDS